MSNENFILKLNIPEYYVKTIKSLIRFSTFFSCVGILSGLFMREAGRMLPQSLDLAPGDRLAGMLSANLTHGHILTLGMLVPAAIILFMLAAKVCGARDIREKSLRVSLAMFRIGVVASLFLQIYKGIHTEILIRQAFNQPDFLGLSAQQWTLIDSALFFGNKWLRIGLYAISHLLLGSGITMWMISIARSLNQ